MAAQLLCCVNWPFLIRETVHRTLCKSPFAPPSCVLWRDFSVAPTLHRRVTGFPKFCHSQKPDPFAPIQLRGERFRRLFTLAHYVSQHGCGGIRGRSSINRGGNLDHSCSRIIMVVVVGLQSLSVPAVRNEKPLVSGLEALTLNLLI